MSLIPVGVDSQKLKCIFVNHEGVGFWLYSCGNRLLGEAKLLEETKQVLQEFELNTNWLVLEIAENEFNKLSTDIKLKNSTSLSEQEIKEVLVDENKLKLEVEFYVRSLIQNMDLSHPSLKPYRERIGKLFMGNKTIEHQKMVIFAALKTRYIGADSVEIDKNDKEVGYVTGTNIAKGELNIGFPHLKPEDLDNPMFSEPLMISIYRFAIAEHNGTEYLTSKQVNERTENTAVTDGVNEEKKGVGS